MSIADVNGQYRNRWDHWADANFTRRSYQITPSSFLGRSALASPHRANVAGLVDAQALGSVHVRKIDAQKSAFRYALPPRDAKFFVVSTGQGEFGAGEGIRTLDPDLGKVV